MKHNMTWCIFNEYIVEEGMEYLLYYYDKIQASYEFSDHKFNNKMEAINCAKRIGSDLYFYEVRIYSNKIGYGAQRPSNRRVEY